MIIWRGYGFLAIVMLVPFVGSFAVFGDMLQPRAFFLALAGSLLLGGFVCIYAGILLNRDSYEHTLYFIPLQVFGWLYLGFCAFVAGAAILGAFMKGLAQPDRLNQAIAGGATLIVVAGVAILAVKLARNAVAKVHARIREETHAKPLPPGAPPWTRGRPSNQAER
jgi:hypothetical protein